MPAYTPPSSTVSSLSEQSFESSVQELPTEILCSIFAYALPSIEWAPDAHGSPPRHDEISHRVQVAIVISHVSSRWRDVALDTPWLWNMTRVNWSPFSLGHVDSHLSLTKELLARSRDHPTRLSLYVAEKYASNFAEDCARGFLSDPYLRQSCRVLDVATDEEQLDALDVNTLLRVLADFPRLAHLTLPNANAHLSDLLIPSREPAKRATLGNLRRLQISIGNPADADALFDSDLVWARLETLVVTYTAAWPYASPDTLARCFPRLQELFVAVEGLDMEPPSPSVLPRVHPTLRVLGLTTDHWRSDTSLEDGSGDSTFLRGITVPSLESLLVPIRCRSELEVVARLLDRSECHLDAVRLTVVVYCEWTVTKEEVEEMLPGVRVFEEESLFGSAEFRQCKGKWYALN
ncbi:hypothetical protein CONPUDRAFT_154575 [Coniophora puteana RWD-64-598 SS2]|uniref:Uncharacterized protein n=1 Tax=Coniophora puteana (strain RWD-64-598) TaxID=741705 RepID=A0A5M3MNB6_CONPW|nr:uncharacterized protein CONPUDRAFT_154575 [Coniophora puteana RWD-64-598 SS2]EIW80547.1 hypothetical protein CONPUDRAFT_154575 [Coniophora puteana RWD-64-598 SS2]